MDALLSGSELMNNDALAPLRADLVRGEQAKAALAIVRQKRIDEANSRIERKHVDGLGELVMTVDADVFFRMRVLHGDECWSDEHFLKSFGDKNPGARLRSKSPKLTMRI